MSVVSRRVTRLDNRNRVVLPEADSEREYAIDSLPGGAFLVTPCTTTIETDFERWLKAQVPNIEEILEQGAQGRRSWAEIKKESHGMQGD